MTMANGSIISTVRIPRLEEAEAQIERLCSKVRALIWMIIFLQISVIMLGASSIILATEVYR